MSKFLDSDGLSYFYGKLKDTFALKGESGGGISNLVLLWTNSAPTSAFAQQTIALDLTPYDAVVIEANTSGNTATGRTMQFGLVGTSVRLMAEIYQIHRRLATITSSGITFGNNYYLPTYATGSESEANTYLIPTRIYGLLAVNPQEGKTLLWQNASPTANFNAQTVTLGEDASDYDAFMVEMQYTTGARGEYTSFINNDGKIHSLPVFRHPDEGANYTVGWRNVTISGTTAVFTKDTYQNTVGGGSDNATAIPYAIYGIKFGGTSSTPKYRSGDTETVVSTTSGEPYALIVGGFMTDSSTRMYFTVHLPCSMTNVTPSITSLRMNVRHVGGGYATSSSYVSGGLQVVGASGYTVNCNKINDYDLTIGITHTNFNGTSNTPVGLEVDELIISFS